MKRFGKMSLFVGFLTFFTFGYASGDIHYVTQTGGGGAISVAQFNNLTGDYSGHTFFFSNELKTRVVVSQIYGTARGQVTLDGWPDGDCDPINSVCTGSAVLSGGMTIQSTKTVVPSYITIQDFRITTPQAKANGIHVSGTSGQKIEHLILRRNYIYEAGDRIAAFYHMRYSIIDGNKFYGCGHASIALDFYTETAVTLVDVGNSLFANNEVAHDGTPIKKAPHGNSELVALHGTSNLLIEYNNLHSSPGQTCLRPKEGWGGVTNTITRFNKIHSGATHNFQPHTNSASPHYNHYIYGNYIYGATWWGVAVGNYINDVYVWSNIFANNGRGGMVVYGASNNIHFYNNTVAGNNTSGETEVGRGGFSVSSGVSGSEFYLRNNIFYNNRPRGETNRIQVRLGKSSTIEHNLYFHSDGTPTIWWDGAARTISTIQNSYNMENEPPAVVVTDPGFSNVSAGDFRLSGGHVDSAADLSSVMTVNLSGGNALFESRTGYSTITMNFRDALHPNTNWIGQPSSGKIVMANQNNYGSGWERGAYVFVDGHNKKDNFAEIPKTTILDRPMNIILAPN